MKFNVKLDNSTHYFLKEQNYENIIRKIYEIEKKLFTIIIYEDNYFYIFFYLILYI